MGFGVPLIPLSKPAPFLWVTLKKDTPSRYTVTDENSNSRVWVGAVPGKWNQGLKPVDPWWLNFDPYPYHIDIGAVLLFRGLGKGNLVFFEQTPGRKNDQVRFTPR